MHSGKATTYGKCVMLKCLKSSIKNGEMERLNCKRVVLTTHQLGICNSLSLSYNSINTASTFHYTIDGWVRHRSHRLWNAPTYITRKHIQLPIIDYLITFSIKLSVVAFSFRVLTLVRSSPEETSATISNLRETSLLGSVVSGSMMASTIS